MIPHTTIVDRIARRLRRSTMGRRLRIGRLLEAAGATDAHVNITTRIVATARLTGEDLVMLQQHGIDIRPALDYVHRHYRPTGDQ